MCEVNIYLAILAGQDGFFIGVLEREDQGCSFASKTQDLEN